MVSDNDSQSAIDELIEAAIQIRDRFPVDVSNYRPSSSERWTLYYERFPRYRDADTPCERIKADGLREAKNAGEATMVAPLILKLVDAVDEYALACVRFEGGPGKATQPSREFEKLNDAINELSDLLPVVRQGVLAHSLAEARSSVNNPLIERVDMDDQIRAEPGSTIINRSDVAGSFNTWSEGPSELDGSGCSKRIAAWLRCAVPAAIRWILNHFVAVIVRLVATAMLAWLGLSAWLGLGQ